jgi:hypothetical protein
MPNACCRGTAGDQGARADAATAAEHGWQLSWVYRMEHVKEMQGKNAYHWEK